MSENIFDIFISYSSKDQQIATTIYKRLTIEGYKVWLDKEEIFAGDSITKKVFTGIENSKNFAIILSSNSTKSHWVEEELYTANIKQIENKSINILPILYEDCSIPTSLLNKKYANFTESPDEGMADILRALERNNKKMKENFENNNVSFQTLEEEQDLLKKALHGDEELFLALDIGGTKVYASLVNKNATRLFNKKFVTENSAAQNKFSEFIQDCIRITIAKIHEKCDFGYENILKRISAFGVAFPGPTDFENGIILDAPNLNMKNFPLAQQIQNTFGIPTFLDNDVNLGVLGESWKGVAKGYKNVVGIIIGTGIGGGIIIDNKVYRGSNFTAGEIGHIVVDYDSNISCGCGQFGCIEALASRKMMGKKLSKIMINKGKNPILWSDKNLGSNEIADVFLQQEPNAIRIVREASLLCGKLVFSILNLLNPDIIFFGGGLIRQIGDEFLVLVREEAKKCMNAVYSAGENEIPIVVGDLNNPIITGCCKMAIENTEKKAPTTNDTIIDIMKSGLSQDDYRLLKAMHKETLSILFSRDPRSSLDKEKLRKLRNRGLIQTTEGLSFKNSRHVELTKIGKILVKNIVDNEQK